MFYYVLHSSGRRPPTASGAAMSQRRKQYSGGLTQGTKQNTFSLPYNYNNPIVACNILPDGCSNADTCHGNVSGAIFIYESTVNPLPANVLSNVSYILILFVLNIATPIFSLLLG